MWPGKDFTFFTKMSNARSQSQSAFTVINVYSCSLTRSMVELLFVDHPRSGVVYNFEGTCLSVCMTVLIYMYVYQTTIFESLDNVRNSFSHILYISTGYGSRSYMVIGHQVSVKLTGAKVVANAFSCIYQHRLAPDSATHSMRRGWSRLGLEGMLVLHPYV